MGLRGLSYLRRMTQVATVPRWDFSARSRDSRGGMSGGGARAFSRVRRHGSAEVYCRLIGADDVEGRERLLPWVSKGTFDGSAVSDAGRRDGRRDIAADVADPLP